MEMTQNYVKKTKKQTCPHCPVGVSRVISGTAMACVYKEGTFITCTGYFVYIIYDNLAIDILLVKDYIRTNQHRTHISSLSYWEIEGKEIE